MAPHDVVTCASSISELDELSGVGSQSTTLTVPSADDGTPLPSGSKAQGIYKNCNVCRSTDMAKGMKQCKLHNKSVRSIVASLDAKDKQDGGKARKEFEECRDRAPEHPPSEFSAAVFDIEEKIQARAAARREVIRASARPPVLRNTDRRQGREQASKPRRCMKSNGCIIELRSRNIQQGRRRLCGTR